MLRSDRQADVDEAMDRFLHLAQRRRQRIHFVDRGIDLDRSTEIEAPHGLRGLVQTAQGIRDHARQNDDQRNRQHNDGQHSAQRSPQLMMRLGEQLIFWNGRHHSQPRQPVEAHRLDMHLPAQAIGLEVERRARGGLQALPLGQKPLEDRNPGPIQARQHGIDLRIGRAKALRRFGLSDDAPVRIEQDDLRPRGRFLRREQMVQCRHADVRPHHRPPIGHAVGESCANQPAGIENVRRRGNAPRAFLRGQIPRTLARVERGRVIRALGFAQRVQRRIEKHVSAPPFASFKRNALDQEAGGCRRSVTLAFDVVVHPAHEEEIAIFKPRIHRNQLFVVEQGFVQQREQVHPFGMGAAAPQGGPAQQARRVFRRIDDMREGSPGFAPDAFAQGLGALLQYAAAVLETDPGQQPTDNQDQDHEQDRDMHVQGVASLHGDLGRRTRKRDRNDDGTPLKPC